MNDYTRILLRNVCDGDLSRAQKAALVLMWIPKRM